MTLWCVIDYPTRPPPPPPPPRSAELLIVRYSLWPATTRTAFYVCSILREFISPGLVASVWMICFPIRVNTNRSMRLAVYLPSFDPLAHSVEKMWANIFTRGWGHSSLKLIAIILVIENTSDLKKWITCIKHFTLFVNKTESENTNRTCTELTLWTRQQDLNSSSEMKLR